MVTFLENVQTRTKVVHSVTFLEKVQTRRKVVHSGLLYQNNVKEVFNILNIVHPKFLKMETPNQIESRILSRSSIEKDLRKSSNNEFYEDGENTLAKDDNHKRKELLIKDLREMTSKLKPGVDSPFRVQKKINDNAYKIELLGHYNVSAAFDVSDLSPYSREIEDDENSRTIFSQAGEENDADL
nr:protein chromatin remodeling 35-like [Tanacetum cinerariifolium]